MFTNHQYAGQTRLSESLPTRPLFKMRQRPVINRARVLRLRGLLVMATAWAMPALNAQPPATPPAASQNPSPMVENTRRHERLTDKALPGDKRTFVGPASKPVDVFVPSGLGRRDVFELLVHFHGASWIPAQAASALNSRTVVATVNIGTGSGGYDRAFLDPATFDTLLAAVTREVAAATGHPRQVGHITLAGFSAGHGAIRAIIRDARLFAMVDAVLLIDGMHTSYVPEGTVLSLGGAIDTTNLVAFTNFARAAIRGEKRFLVTHSEIFPGTFVSTTETADWMLGALGIKRTPVLKWGPRGTQQLSEVRAGRFTLLGFAGNSAPDHIDQFHALPELLARLSKQ